MQSNQSPEVTSTYSHLQAQHNTDNSASSSPTNDTISQSKSTPSNFEDDTHKRKIAAAKYLRGTPVAETMKPTKNGTDQKPTKSKDAKRCPKTDSDSEDYYGYTQESCTQTSESHYEAMLNLAPDVNSIEEGRRLFEILIGPLEGPNFMKNYWEQRPLRVDRKSPGFFKDLLSSEAVDKMLRKNHVEFTKNIDIQFNDGNETVTPIGRALPPTIWRYYSNGCGIKISNPQTFLPAIHSTNAALQEYFQCKIDSNIYLGSKNSEGYEPRYDDAETFILQIEGNKHWCVYQPTDRKHLLPRQSKSANAIGVPVIDVVLRSGDLLYFPRGYIHEATTAAESHSLHLTLKVYRSQTYGDLMQILIPMALNEAIAENVNLRKGLPLDIWQNMGVVNSDSYKKERAAVIAQIIACIETLGRHVTADANLDNAVDQMGSRLQHDALPPKLTKDEISHSVYGAKITTGEDGSPEYSYIDLNTKIRLIRWNVLRMARNDNGIRVYYSSENSKEHHGFAENYIEIDPSDAPAIEVLIKAYPSFITPSDLQLDNDDKNLFVAQDLWERGILLTNDPC